MSRQRIRVQPFAASAMIGGSGGTAGAEDDAGNIDVGRSYAVTLHNLILTETAGVANEVLVFHVPTPIGDGSSIITPVAGGTAILTVEIPKGTTVVLHELDWFFPDGLYIVASGGTLSAAAGIS